MVQQKLLMECDGTKEGGTTKTVDGDDEAANTPCIAEVSLYIISFTLFAESIIQQRYFLFIRLPLTTQSRKIVQLIALLGI
jgi:hypothetical protein